MEDENRKTSPTKSPRGNQKDRGTVTLPHLKSIDKLKKNPLVNEALRRSRQTVEMLKSYSPMFLVTCHVIQDAVRAVVDTAAPIVSKYEAPIRNVDQTLAKGIEKLEENAPIITEKSMEIFNHAKNAFQKIIFVDELKVAGQQAINESVEKASEVLAEKCDEVVNKIDRTSDLAETLIDYYLPETGPNIECCENPIPAADDPLLHTVQIVEGLSKKVTKRAFENVRRQIRQVKTEDIKGYWRSLHELAETLESNNGHIENGNITHEENY